MRERSLGSAAGAVQGPRLKAAAQAATAVMTTTLTGSTTIQLGIESPVEHLALSFIVFRDLIF
jgi:hypothetical protein